MEFVPFALAVLAGLFVLTVVLPIATFQRTRKLVGEIRRIDARLDSLESELLRTQSAARKAAVAEDHRPAMSPAAPVVAAATFAIPPALPVRPSVPAPAAAPAKPAVSEKPVEVTTPAIPKAPATGRADSLESRIGGRWLLYIGTAALVLGIGFFVKYAFDNN